MGLVLPARNQHLRPVRRGFWLTGCVLLLACLTPAPAPAAGAALPPLDEVLASLDRTSRLYLDNALRFTCDETIVHQMGNGRRAYRFNYIYAFTEEGLLRDHRLTRRGWDKIANGTKAMGAPREVKLFEYGLPTWMSRAYNWIFVFESARWELYDFELLGRDVRMDRPALKIRFQPRSSDPDSANDWVGTAWVDAETYQMLHVDAQRLTDHLAQLQLERDLAESRSWKSRRKVSHSIFTVSTTYAAERNGIRLPTDVQLETTRFVVRGGEQPPHYFEYPSWSVHQSYDNYRLFGIETRGRVGKYFERRREAQ